MNNQFAAGSGPVQIHVPSRLLGTPLMISKSEADLIMSALHGPLPAGMFMPFYDDEEQRRYDVKNGVAIIPIMGGLTYRGYGWTWRSTYGQIRNLFRHAVANPEVKAIVFDIASNGGEIAGVFDLIDEIHAARGKKPIHAVANEHAFSAAYGIGSAADKLYLPRTGSAGSVGVIAIHYEQSKAEADYGIKYTAIFAGDRKNDFSIHEPLSDGAMAVARASVNRANDMFVAAVARNRGLAEDAVRGQQAGIYEGSDAVDAGLADGVKTFEEVLDELSGGNTTPTNTGGNHMDTEQIRTSLAMSLTDTESKAGVIEMLSKMGFTQSEQSGQDEEKIAARVAEAVDKAVETAVGAERQRAQTIAEKCVLSGKMKMAPKLISEGTTVEAAATRILEANHNEDPSRGLDNANGGPEASGADFLMADAKRRAGIQ